MRNKLLVLLLCLCNFVFASNGQATANNESPAAAVFLPALESNLQQTKSINVMMPNSVHLSKSQLQIGGSFFTNNESDVSKKVINQIGIAYQARPNLSDAFIFFNQLLPNNIFYEVRAYGVYNYITSTQSQLLPSNDLSNQPNPLGYGFTGILGYNFEITKSFTLLPYFRSDYFYDFATVYSDSDGNNINSKTYTNYLGAKASFRINNELAMYVNYYLGYQIMQLYGTGIFNVGSPAVNGAVSNLEFGLPYRINHDWSITPYILSTTIAPSPNAGASSSPYNISSSTFNNITYSVRLSYNF